MDERFQELDQSFTDLLNANISYEELGTASGYHAAELVKNDTCEFSITLIEKVNELSEFVNSSILDDGYTHLQATAKHLRSIKDQIEKTVLEGVHNNNFPNQRTAQINNLEAHSSAVKKNTSPLELALRVAELEQKVGRDESLDVITKKLQLALKKAEVAAREAEGISSVLRDKAAEKGVITATGAFQVLSDDHKTRENLWFIGFVLSSIIFILVIVYILNNEILLGDLEKVIYEIFKRFLLLTTVGLAIKITIGKYNLERNLRIIYDHRSTTLQQFEIFEKAIVNDDADAKNQLRLDVARYVFSDPDTGYRGASSTNELNINPVLTTVEKVIRKREVP